jgi:hypothetical protein
MARCDARLKAIGLITGSRLDALEAAGITVVYQNDLGTKVTCFISGDCEHRDPSNKQCMRRAVIIDDDQCFGAGTDKDGEVK